jgi:O-antigen/teichoic acid export membrane protein
VVRDRAGPKAVKSPLEASLSTPSANSGAPLAESRGLARVPRFLRSTFARDVAQTYSTRLLLAVMSVVTSIITARILGPSGRGLYAVALATAAIGVQCGNLGLHSAGTYYVGQDRRNLPLLLGNALVVSFGFAGILVAVAEAIFETAPSLAPVRGALRALTLVSIPISLAYLLLQNLLLGIQDLRAFNGIEIVTRLLMLVWICVLSWLGRVSVEGVFLATFGSAVLGFGWTLHRLVSRSTRSPSISLPLFRAGLHYGLKAYLASLFAFLLLRVDIFMVRGMLGAESAGYYAVAANVADVLYLLPSTVGMILFPKLSALADDLEKWPMARRVSVTVLAAMMLLAAATAVIAEPLVRLLFGASFHPAAPAVRILAIAMIFYGTNNVVSACLAAMGFPWFAVWVWLIAAAANVLLNVLWIPRFGICGAAAASLVGYALVLLFQVSYLSRSTR